MREKVIVIGGGVAGLTAAHELIERDFEVHVFERRDYLGGKAASVEVPRRTAPPSTPNNAQRPYLPGEHGFRFFPGWYKHLPDTLKRIPFLGKRQLYEGQTVLDNLVALSASVLTWTGADPVTLPLRVPTHLAGVAQVIEFLGSFGRLALTVNDATFFANKLVPFLTLPDEELVRRFENISWWAYLECERRSDAFKDLMRATTRTMVAAKVEEASAFTIGRLAVRTLMDLVGTVDSILNGPTTDAWIAPWQSYLDKRGVKFHFGWELDAIELSNEKNEIIAITVDSFAGAEARRLRRYTSRAKYGFDIFRRTTEDIKASPKPSRDPDSPTIKHITEVTKELRYDIHDAQNTISSLEHSLAVSEQAQDLIAMHQNLLAEATTELNRVDELLEKFENQPHKPAGPQFLEFLSSVPLVVPQRAAVALDGKSRDPGTDPTIANTPIKRVERLAAIIERRLLPVRHRADYFVFALPVEQMAYYVNRSQALQVAAPELLPLIQLTRHLDWMTGVQFYLGESFEGPRGHIVCMNSEWALTAIEQARHWRDTPLPKGVKAIISVDISNWGSRGRFVRKEPYNCTPDEIAKEVWEQLKLQLNSPSTILRDEMLLGGKNDNPQKQFARDSNYHLDNAIVDIKDRDKQALYEQARGVIERELAKPDVAADELPLTRPYMWGLRRNYNVEPLLINRVGSRKFRPPPYVANIRNMYLASDYVLTQTDLACMEGANEAARLAVNCILDATSSRHERCQTWKLSLSPELPTAPSIASGLSIAAATVSGLSNAGLSLANNLLSGLGRQVTSMIGKGPSTRIPNE